MFAFPLIPKSMVQTNNKYNILNQGKSSYFHLLLTAECKLQCH